MTELKTLKDLDDYEMFSDSCFVFQIRAEAVKWIKIFEGKKDLFIKDAQNYDEVMASNQGKINIFKYFFNLTEEDLKND